MVEFIKTGNEGLSKLADALKLCTFDPLQFPHGGLYFEVEEFAEAFDRARGTSRAFPVAVVHANFIIGLPHKIQALKKWDLWFANEERGSASAEGQCKQRGAAMGGASYEAHDAWLKDLVVKRWHDRGEKQRTDVPEHTLEWVTQLLKTQGGAHVK